MNSVNFGSCSYICVIDMGKWTFKHILLFILVLSRSNISITNNLDITCYCYLQGLRKF